MSKKVHVKVPQEVEYRATAEPEPAQAAWPSLVPEKWDGASNELSEPKSRYDFVLTPQVAEVLLIGIDRVVELGDRQERDLREAWDEIRRLNDVRRRLREFIINVHHRLAQDPDAGNIVAAIREAITALGAEGAL